MSKLIARLGIALALASPLCAWNATGHRVIAFIAYERLTPAARARVDQLLKNHADFAGLSGREAFLAAAVWPDTIKSDPRFFDDLRDSAHPTPLLPGFPDMARHTDWHYLDQPYSPDGTRPTPGRPRNALTEMRRLVREIGSYSLPWIEHIEGDLHQPLHCVSRFLASQPEGDQGGNRVFVKPGKNLHTFWDGVMGKDTTSPHIATLAAQLTSQFPAPRDLSTDPGKWLQEGLDLAQHEVYAFGPETGSREHPIRLPASYQRNTKRIGRERVALAGYRLAALLNEKLK